MYAGCPIVWASKLQTLVALSTTKAEYVALSSTIHDDISTIQLIDNIKKKGLQVLYTLLHVNCKGFKDNANALELACLPKM